MTIARCVGVILRRAWACNRSVESERTIGLDWQEGRRRILTLTVDERSSLGFAALFANEPLHGRVLTRYITDEDHIDWKRKEAKWRAFRPKPIDHDLSIARINDLDELGIWGLGHELAEQPSGRTVYGRADFYSPDVLAAEANGFRLRVVPAPPPARHAAIEPWHYEGRALRSRARCAPAHHYVLAVLPMVASLALVLK